jgi:DNA mismatch repair protein MutL
MPQTIRVLPEHLANKIAAGEVIQRPASAVKELLENSIDAGAQSVTLLVTRGGKALIQVIDDGSGMGPVDAALAFDRHATSKISTVEDLEHIRTLGFRGEALASIAAVAQVEMRTRRAQDELGTRIRIEGGVVLESVPDAVPAGTSISAKNLYYNTPARRKFLKSDATEYKQVYEAVLRIALGHPGLSLKFVSDDEVILDVRPAPPEERVAAVFGEKLAQTVFPFEDAVESVRLRGFLGRPRFARKTHAAQYLFLNDRFVVNRSLSHAVFKAYEHLLEKGSFPFFVLHLTVDPGKVDVNVHPSKLEVKFEDEGSMYRFVHSAVRKALSEHDLIPRTGVREPDAPGAGARLSFLPDSAPAGPRVSDWRELIRTRTEAERNAGDAPAGAPAAQVREREPAANAPSPGAPLWQIHHKYIAVPVEDGVLIVDQHAAHERVLYERAMARFDTPGGNVQQLLFPHTVELAPGDAALVGDLLPLLEGLGFSVKLFGKTTAILDGVPVDLKPGAEKTILQEIVDLFQEDSHNVRLAPREKLAISFSCRAAVKAGDPLNPPEMHSLLDQLFATKVPFVCPHGRPSMIRLSLAELDRRFGRTS